MKRTQWIISAEVSLDDGQNWRMRREVVFKHPFIWAAEQEDVHRVVIRLLHWEEVDVDTAAMLRRRLGV